MRSGIVDGLSANVAVDLLTGETILISTVEGKTTTCSAIWNRVEGELVARGVVQPHIFGLAIQTGSDWVFVDPDAKVSKYFPKEWKSTPGSINNESKTLTLYCRVHFYLEALPQNFDVVSHLHYYLQLRENLIASPRKAAPATEINQQLVQPLAFAYQSELGDWRPCQERPQWVKNLNLGSALTRAHQALTGLGQASARMAFIRSVMPQVNRHLYSMTLRTKDGKDSPVWIAVTPKGIEVYQSGVSRTEIPEQPKVTFLWANITKLYFERKKFEIRGRACPCGGSTEKLIFTAPSESVPRHLLLLCRSTHQFSLSQHRLHLTTTVGSTASTTMGNSSSSSTTGDSGCVSIPTTRSGTEEKMLDLSLWADGLLLTGESSEHQRVSVISNASSNTTSGIVSDRVYSLDGSEEDLDLRGISDCCTERTQHMNNSISLESLSHKHSTVPRPQHFSKLNVRTVKNVGIGTMSCGTHGNNTPQNENEAMKYWYCDSDCEDCDDAAGTCRSILVRTIGEKEIIGSGAGAVASQCECNSCTAAPPEDELDGLNLSNAVHQHTPSIASEVTLKAVDISGDEKIASTFQATDASDGVAKDSVQKSSGRCVTLRKDSDDPTEHIYGEICEDQQKLEDDVQYCTIGSTKTRAGIAVPQAAPRKEKPMNEETMFKQETNRKDQVCKNKICPSTNITTATAKKSDGLTPKIASLKCLRTRRVPPWTFSRKYDSKELEDETDSGHGFVTNKQLQQGRYPSTRTVSDNFDTDSDYVQLPPLLPRLYPKKTSGNKLWKFVTSKAHKSCGNVHQLSLEDLERHGPAPPVPPHNSSAGTVPRKKPAVEYSHSVSEIHKTTSRSCVTALNSLGIDGRPEPPPKPKKLLTGSELRSTKPVDARFIATKPQILIQTAYAAPAPVAVSSQAQILFRGSKVPSVALRTKPKGKSMDANSFSTQLYHSQSVDNIYDTVACEDSYVSPSGQKTPGRPKTSISKPRPQTPPPLYPKNMKTSAKAIPVIILPNNYIDVHASGVTRSKPIIQSSQGIGSGKTIGTSRCESVPNNLNINFMIGLQNLKPLSRAPIVYPATAVISANARNNRNSIDSTKPNNNYHLSSSSAVGVVSSQNWQNKPRMHNTSSVQGVNPIGPQSNGSQFTTVYTSQLSRSQIKQFKAELYSDTDYVIFPPKDPRVSQQEYFDSKGLSFPTTSTTTSGVDTTGSTHSSYASMNDIPPPYLPPPPPYPIPGTPPTMTLGKPSSAYSTPAQSHHGGGNISTPLPPRNFGSQPTSYQSLYNALSSNASQCSSSQYGYYAVGGGSGGLNAENLQRFLSTQSLAGSSNLSAAPIYYPSSTHSAPPLPPYKNNTSQSVIENGMRKAVYQIMANGMTSEERIRMKLCQSDDSLCSQQTNELQVMYNLPPPPPYHQKPIMSPSEVDLVKLRAKCTALELPLLKALCSDGDLLTQTKPRTKIRPTAHAHPKQGSKELSLPARPPKSAKFRQQSTNLG